MFFVEYPEGPLPKKELYGRVQLELTRDRKKFYPILYTSQMHVLHKKSKMIKSKTKKVNFKISIQPLSWGFWRMYTEQERQFEGMKQQFGMTLSDLDQIKMFYVDVNKWLLFCTLTVAVLHSMFSVLAMKNEISFWNA